MCNLCHVVPQLVGARGCAYVCMTNRCDAVDARGGLKGCRINGQVAKVGLIANYCISRHMWSELVFGHTASDLVFVPHPSLREETVMCHAHGLKIDFDRKLVLF